MVFVAQKIVIEQAGPDAVLPFVALAIRYDTTGGEQSALHIARDGGYIVRDNGNACAGFTLRYNGSECYVTAAGATRPGIDITRLITAALAGKKGVQSIAFQTRRRGLIRKAERLGYRQAGQVKNGVIMRKVLHAENS